MNTANRVGAVLVGAGGALTWVGARMDWFTVEVFDDRAGASTATVDGSTWSTEIAAVSLLLIVAMIAIFALRRFGRRLVGVVAALGAVGAGASGLRTLVSEPDQGRLHTLLSAGSGDQGGAASEGAIAAWAEITQVQQHSTGVALVVVGAVLGLLGALLVVARPGVDSAKLNKYETEAVRREKLGEDLAARPDSGRVMWDALDSGIDPTDDEAAR